MASMIPPSVYIYEGPAELRARGPRNNQTDPGRSRKQSKKSPKTIKHDPKQIKIINNQYLFTCMTRITYYNVSFRA